MFLCQKLHRDRYLRSTDSPIYHGLAICFFVLLYFSLSEWNSVTTHKCALKFQQRLHLWLTFAVRASRPASMTFRQSLFARVNVRLDGLNRNETTVGVGPGCSSGPITVAVDIKEGVQYNLNPPHSWSSMRAIYVRFSYWSSVTAFKSATMMCTRRYKFCWCCTTDLQIRNQFNLQA